MLLDDLELAVAEESLLRRPRRRDHRGSLDAGIGPYPEQLAAIARRSGLNIVAGTGFYVQRAHPAWVASATSRSWRHR